MLRGKPTIETVEVDPTGKQVGEPIKVVPGSGRQRRVPDDRRAAFRRRAKTRSPRASPRRARSRTPRSRITSTFDKAPARRGRRARHAGRFGGRDGEQPGVPAVGLGRRISQQAFNELSAPDAHNPLLNRATEGLYAPGSAFKLVTAVAVDRDRRAGRVRALLDTGSFKIGNDPPLTNDGGVAYGSIDLQRALGGVERHVLLYRRRHLVEPLASAAIRNGLGIQQVAREFGFGSKTGIELSEAAGRIPDPKWKQEFAEAFYKTSPQQQANGIWYPGDNVHLAVGQGDTLVTPLQLADAYAGFANGGTHLDAAHRGTRVIDPMTKKVVRTIAPQAAQATSSIDGTCDRRCVPGSTARVHANRWHRARRVPGTSGSPFRRGQDRNRAGLREGRHVGVRELLPDATRPATSSSHGRGSRARRRHRRADRAPGHRSDERHLAGDTDPSRTGQHD